ncbi:AIPR family protein [Mesoplasma coleopterae]|uniref:Abortive phage infection protein C-terminal domain-containing protein n=1 Tax=Mesoplasma coleopterae TaxID=324078 RepID=A0A2K8P3Y3_9MOLU|nr:AIPR family protein [Mesoplasma coleopterae]ATZ20840.1 hypothetical protein MCOLE_v1c03260 [Mesoplasma coleopterae]
MKLKFNSTIDNKMSMVRHNFKSELDTFFRVYRDEYIYNEYEGIENEKEFLKSGSLKLVFENIEQDFELFFLNEVDYLSDDDLFKTIQRDISSDFKHFKNKNMQEVKWFNHVLKHIDNYAENNHSPKLIFNFNYLNKLPNKFFTKFINKQVRELEILFSDMFNKKVEVQIRLLGFIELNNKIMQYISEEGVYGRTALEYLKTSETASGSVLEFGDSSEGVITRLAVVKASSLKKIYKSLEEKYDLNSLFSWNVREYFRDNKVDNKIKNTLENKPNDFFTFNNGLTIIGENIERDGTNIKIDKMCILNGAQTTTLISTIDDDKLENVGVFAKIIDISSFKNDEEKQEYISSLSQASNNQKPVKTQDLLSQEQKIKEYIKGFNSKVSGNDELKVIFKSKKGSIVQKNKEVKILTIESFLKNALWSVCLQPGLARSGFGDFLNKDQAASKTFEKVFSIFDLLDNKKESNLLLIKDILEMDSMFNSTKAKMVREFKSRIEPNSTERIKQNNLFNIEILNNAKLFIQSTIFYLWIYLKSPEIENQVLDINKMEQLFSFYKKNKILDGIFNKNRIVENDLEIRFDAFINAIFTKIVDIIKETKDVSVSVTNFTKTQSSFKAFIKEFVNEIKAEPEILEKCNLLFNL